MFLSIAVAFLLFIFVAWQYSDEFYRRVASVALVGHLIVATAIVPRLPYQWDIAQFDETATKIVTGTFTGGSTTVSSFSALQAILYTLFTPHPETLGVFNGLMAVLVVIPIVYLTGGLYPELPRRCPAVMLVVLFLPLQFLFLSVPMRDTFSVVLLFTLLAVLFHVFRTGRTAYGLPAIPLWGVLFLVRPELSLIVVLGATAAVAVSVIRVLETDISVQSLTLLLGFIATLGFGLFAEFLFSFERANRELVYRSTGGAVYLDGMSYSSWADFLLAAPARGIYFQFAPFPLHVESVFHLLAFVSSILVIVLFVSGVRSLSRCEYNETVAVFLVVVYLTGIVGYGTINSNFGTNVRHRIAFDFLLVVFASPVLHQWWLRVRSWVGIVPSQSSHENEQECETQELDRGVHRGRQHPDKTH